MPCLHAQDEHPDTPVEVHLPMIWKIISLDRNAKKDIGPSLRVGVIFQSKNRASFLNKEKIIEVLKRKNSNENSEQSIMIFPIEATDPKLLEEDILDADVNVLYITSLRAIDIKEIANIARRHKIRTFTGIAAYVSEGIAVGFDLKGEHTQMVINLTAARSEGADYPVYVLKLARVIK